MNRIFSLVYQMPGQGQIHHVTQGLGNIICWGEVIFLFYLTDCVLKDITLGSDVEPDRGHYLLPGSVQLIAMQCLAKLGTAPGVGEVQTWSISSGFMSIPCDEVSLSSGRYSCSWAVHGGGSAPAECLGLTGKGVCCIHLSNCASIQ